MLKPVEIVQVFGMALVGMVVLYIIYSLAWFILAHIFWITGIAIALAIGGVYVLSQQKIPVSR
jgi:hypothetical protein